MKVMKDKGHEIKCIYLYIYTKYVHMNIYLYIYIQNMYRGTCIFSILTILLSWMTCCCRRATVEASLWGRLLSTVSFSASAINT